MGAQDESKKQRAGDTWGLPQVDKFDQFDELKNPVLCGVKTWGCGIWKSMEGKCRTNRREHYNDFFSRRRLRDRAEVALEWGLLTKHGLCTNGRLQMGKRWRVTSVGNESVACGENWGVACVQHCTRKNHPTRADQSGESVCTAAPRHGGTAARALSADALAQFSSMVRGVSVGALRERRERRIGC